MTKFWSAPYSGVTAFTGMPGSGKSYGLIEVANRTMKRGEMPVYANAGFTIQGVTRYIEDWEDFVSIQGPAVIVWDELPLFFAARKWQDFPDGFLYKLTQIRKDGLRLYYSTIDEHLVDINLRRCTFWWWKCRPVTARILMRRLYPHDAYRARDQKPFRTEWVFVRPAIADLYDTGGKIALPERTLVGLTDEQQDLLRGDKRVKLEVVNEAEAEEAKAKFSLPDTWSG